MKNMWINSKFKNPFYSRHVRVNGKRQICLYGETTKGISREFLFSNAQKANEKKWTKVK